MKVNIQEEWLKIIEDALIWLRELVASLRHFLQTAADVGNIGADKIKQGEALADKADSVLSSDKPDIGVIKSIGKSITDFINSATEGESIGMHFLSRVGKTSGASDLMPGLSDPAAGAVTMAGGALAALLLLGAYKTYKTNFTQAAKACANFKGEDRDKCMRKYKINAMEAQIMALKTSLDKCKKSKDPSSCNKKVNEKIIKIKKELMDLKREN